MFIVYEMRCNNSVGTKTTVELIPYSSKYKNEYRHIYNECFHEMREALGIEPFDYIQDDSFFGDNMDNVYLLLDNDDIVGSVALKGNEIDDLIVNKRYQHQGFGRQLLLWAIEHIDTDSAILHVAEWNEPAIKLYLNNGFEIIRQIEINA